MILSSDCHHCASYVAHIAGIRLGPRDAQFCTLNAKIAHYFHMKCAIFTSIRFYLVIRYELHTEMVKIAHKIVHKCEIWHITIFSDITPDIVRLTSKTFNVKY